MEQRPQAGSDDGVAHMAETLSTAGPMDMALKDNGIVVDLTPAALLHHNTLAQAAVVVSHAHALRSFKDAASVTVIDEQISLPEPPSTPTNLSTSASPPLTTFRCERCDNFETSSRATLLLHVVQCLAAAGQAVRLKSEERAGEPENMSVGAVQAHMEQQIAKSVTVAGEPASLVVTAVVNGNVGGSHAAASSSSSSSSPAANNTGGTSNANNAARKVFECDVCNMKFSNGANMRRHKMRHTGVKPYECRVCQKRFFRKDHLAEHFTTHTKTLPYHCPICNRGFQRQIAMRAHFQNEHVGQHDLVKTCPLCSYRAGSMKSLRIHFFNRHGIDLDNPGPGGTSSLLLALESQATQVAAAAAAAGFVPGLNPVAAVAAAAAANANNNNNNNNNSNSNNAPASHQSDSGESMRSLENATPPMHFLTPHVEISTLSESGAPELFNGNSAGIGGVGGVGVGVAAGDALEAKVKERALSLHSPVALCAPQDQPMDCNAKTSTMPSSTSGAASGMHNHIQSQHNQHNHSHNHNHNHSHNHSHSHNNHNHNNSKAGVQHQHQHHHHHHHHENHITPSISLIPIKQEPLNDEPEKCAQKEQHSSNGSAAGIGGGGGNGNGSGDGSDSEFSTPNNRITSLIKVSPLKSLLREDLKRRICAKANNRITRNAVVALENNNNNNNNILPHAAAMGAATTPPTSVNATPICNGTITSTGQESDMLLSRKQILTCHFCGIEFPDETLYFLHKGCHCDSNPWKCNICGEQCNNVYEFNSHLLSKSHQ